jgi:hypothetical protein
MANMEALAEFGATIRYLFGSAVRHGQMIALDGGPASCLADA